MAAEKLVLRESMTRTYLIQRLKAPHKSGMGDNPFAFGGGLRNGGLSDEAMTLIRNVFQFDYMGSAEFEFGAVPQALFFLAEQAAANNLVTGFVLVDKGSVDYIIPKPYLENALEVIRTLRATPEKLNLKEHCGLKEYFDGASWKKVGPEPWHKENRGWLELDNGFMFFTDHDMWAKTCQLFGLEIDPVSRIIKGGK